MESVTLLKDILLDKGQIHKYYEGRVPLNLWRGLNVRKNMGLFELIEDTFMLSNGRPRPADITISGSGANAKVMVKDSPRGISTFDKPGIPQGPNWEHYRIPSGTPLPRGLAIVKDQYNPRVGAYHYTIAPAYDMPLAKFKVLLSQLAKSVVKEAV
ncbi:hypothetical protein ACFSJ3_18015 [Corallincola platygyrae]|uniref:Tse2 ADP-ribosyltransferase toxin domain-containing protein n=1 Tax=Corallincola platygyrae TaxID=1193278 RepID=A0ABW4XRE1_9GAMM